MSCCGLPDSASNLCNSSYQQERWYQAVLLAAQGKYALSATILGALAINQRANNPSTSLWSSLVYSTLASHARQLGNHAHAKILDSTALYYISLDTLSEHVFFPPDLPWVKRNYNRDMSFLEQLPKETMAYMDAITGLAADNLGLGNFTHSLRYLSLLEKIFAYFLQGNIYKNYENVPSTKIGDFYIFTVHRAFLRFLWVRTEYEIYSDGSNKYLWATRALEHMELGNDIPLRYRAKTQLIAHAAGATMSKMQYQLLCDELLDEHALPLLWAAYLLDNNECQAAQVFAQFQF